jgi:hypothetical protein
MDAAQVIAMINIANPRLKMPVQRTETGQSKVEVSALRLAPSVRDLRRTERACRYADCWNAEPIAMPSRQASSIFRERSAANALNRR